MSDVGPFPALVGGQGGRVRIRLFGELDLEVSADLHASLLRHIAAGPEMTIIVDLDRVTFIDCAAIAAILDGYTAASAAGVILRLQNAHRMVHRVFEVLGLLLLFTDPLTGPDFASKVPRPPTPA